MPRGIPIATPVGIPVANIIGEPLTNIDAADIAHPEMQARIRLAQQGALPVGQRIDQGDLPDPLWTTRTQSSPNPPNAQGVVTPWVKGYRWWVPNVRYQSWYDDSGHYRIDFLWIDHKHAYHNIPRNVWMYFRSYVGTGGSPGVWFHENILAPNWRRGMGARYPDFEL